MDQKFFVYACCIRDEPETLHHWIQLLNSSVVLSQRDSYSC